MRERRATGPLLWVRALLLGSIALLTGIASHAAAAGLLPSVGSLVALWGGATLTAAWFLRRQLGARRMMLLAVAGQTAAHLALSSLAGHRGDPAAVPGGSHAAGTPHVLDHLTEAGPLMVLSHMAGAVVLGAWLAIGEAMLWSLLAVLSTELLRRCWTSATPVVGGCRIAPRAVVAVSGPRRLLLSVGSLTRRGPPLPVC